MVNTIYLIVKHHIYVQRCMKQQLSFSNIVAAISKVKILEECIARRNHNLPKHQKKWQLYDQV